MSNINKDILLENDITEIMTLINTYREEYEVPPLTYSPELSIISRDVSINLLKSNIRKFEYLSNIDNSSLSRNLLFVRYARNQKMINIKNIINKWYKEEKYYNFDDETDMKYKNYKNFIRK
jgi:hypothetical protein